MPITYHTYYEDDELVIKIKKLQSEKQAEEIERLQANACDICGTKLIDNCLRCGAPQCCPLCCGTQACIDDQQQEIERMTVACNNLKSANRTFAAENAKFKEELAGSVATLECRVNDVQAQAERIEKLTDEYRKLELSWNEAIKKLDAQQQEIEKLEKALTDIRDAEMECCSRCKGNGRLYADHKAHYMSENAPTIACPQCLGDGHIPTADARETAKQALKG